jgi:hypothetical protein
MGITLSKLATDRVEFDFKFSDQSMPITYRPSVLTAEFLSTMSAGQTHEQLADSMERLIADWDLMDKPGGKKLAVGHEAFNVMPLAMIQGMVRACAIDAGLITGDDAEGKVTPNRAVRRSKTTRTASSDS